MDLPRSVVSFFHLPALRFQNRLQRHNSVCFVPPSETFACRTKVVRSIGAAPIDELPNFREECVRKRNGLKQDPTDP